MNFQELSTIWNNADVELENSIKINQKLIKEVSVTKIKSHLFETKWSAIIENLINFFWILFLAQFLINNFAEAKFFIPATILLLFAGFTFIVNGLKLSYFIRINASDSVLKTQQYVEKIKFLEILGLNSLYVIIPLFTIPFAIVMAKSFADLDIYQFPIFGKGLLYYTFGSIVIAIVLVFILKKYTKNSITESISFLKDLKEIENSN
jgi:hypothetical protein